MARKACLMTVRCAYCGTSQLEVLGTTKTHCEPPHVVRPHQFSKVLSAHAERQLEKNRKLDAKIARDAIRSMAAGFEAKGEERLASAATRLYEFASDDDMSLLRRMMK